MQRGSVAPMQNEGGPLSVPKNCKTPKLKNGAVVTGKKQNRTA